MNAAVHILEDLNLADPATEPVPQQRQLANELARARTQAGVPRARVARSGRRARRSLLRNASGISSSSRPARRWRSSRQSAATSCSGAPTRPRSALPSICRLRAAASPSSASGSATWRAARRRCASRSSSTTTRSTRSSARCSKCSTRKSSSATNGRSSARSTRSRARRSCPGSYSGEDDKRFRKSAALALLITMLFSAIVSQITLPPLVRQRPGNAAACRASADGREADAAACAGRNAEAESAARRRSRSSSRCRSRRPSPRSRSWRRRNRKRRTRAFSRSARGSLPAKDDQVVGTPRLAGAHRQLRLRAGARSARC